MRIHGTALVAAMLVTLAGTLALPGCSDQSLTAPAPVVTATAPSIVTQPKNKAVNAGQSATFSVAASGSDPMTYQWSRNGTAMPGATSATYTVSSAGASDDAASFSAAVTNSAGSAVSAAAVLTVHSGDFSAASGVAQKGPLVAGSAVTAQELDASLAATGAKYSYKTSALGTFSPSQLFAHQYVALTATGFYFDEVANQTSSGPVTLSGFCDLGAASVLNVNVLTTLTYQRIQNLVTGSQMSFADAQSQAQAEVLAALGIPNGSSYGAPGTLDISKGGDGDTLLAAVSSLFTYGNNAGAVGALLSSVQSDIGANGAITTPANLSALAAAEAGLNPGAVAANLTQKYSPGMSFKAIDIGQWVDRDGAGVVGRFKFQVTNATSASSFAFPGFVTAQASGQSVSVSAGQLQVNGVAAAGPVTINPGDALALTPGTSPFGSNGVLSAFLTSGTVKLARVLFMTATADLWLPATPLISPRTHHAAVTLPGGKVLVAGGIGPNRVYASAELFDPDTATWSAAGNLAAARFYHSAVALPNGKVLAAGGYASDNHTVLGSAELYDPASNTWSPAGSLATARIEHTATLLPGGKVLVVGGQAGTAASFASAELYDPATNSWSAAGSLSSPRSNHSATLLANGKVLVAGGSNLGVTSPLATAELYDPATNSWSPAANLGVARSGHTATLLPNGRVLVAGGFDNAAGVSLATAELYDPASNSFAPTGSLAASRSVHAATLLANGKVLVAGGQSQASGSSAAALASAELFDPSAGTWSPAASMATRRGYFTASLLPGGGVLAAGGQPGSGIAESVEIYW